MTNVPQNQVLGSEKATITIRLIKSFEHKNWRPFVLRDIDLQIDCESLKSIIEEKLPSSSLPLPFKTLKNLDTFKIEYQAFGAKTSDPLINTESGDENFLKPGVPLDHQGVKNETEITFFKIDDYLKYKNTQNQNNLM